MLRQLRLKFVLVIMVLMAAMLCLIFGMLYRFTAENLESESLGMLRTAADRPLLPDRPGAPPDQMRLPVLLLRLDSHGEVAVLSGGSYGPTDGDFLRALAEAALSDGRQTGVLEDYGLRFYRSAAPDGQRLAYADVTGERAVLSALVRNCALVGVLCLAVFLGLSLLLARWAVRPVERAWRTQRQFVADASHELKTPLTVITTNAELLHDPDYGPEGRARAVESILVMAGQMRALVERLLELARADSANSAAAFAPFDLSDMAERSLLPFEPVFFERGLDLSGEIQPGIIVSGDGEQLRRLLDIFLDNAQKYASPPGEVRVVLRREGRRRCRLSVSNPGPELSPEELRDLFKRFYRVDAARSRDGGFGLGLSIAEEIVRTHRGRVWAESAHGCITFHVELPTAQRS